MSNEEYADCRKGWGQQGMQTLKDDLIWYNNKDIVPFLAALQK